VLARAHRDRALAFLAEVAASDVEDTHGGTTAEGVHLAAMVGGADLLQRCFAGVEPRLDSLYVSPSWPAELGRTTFAVRYQGSDLHLTVSPTRVRVEAEPGGAGTVLVTCGGTTFPLAPGQSHEVDLAAAGTSVAGTGERVTDRQLAQPGRR
jgi:alpha,alpha-trehalase